MARTRHLAATMQLAPLVPLVMLMQVHMIRPMEIMTEESLFVSSILAQVPMTCRVLNANGSITPQLCLCRNYGGTLPLRLLVMVVLH